MTPHTEVVSVIRHEVKPGQEAAYEAWTEEIVPVAESFPGHHGVAVIRPPAGSRLYTVVLHFDTIEHLRAWLDSDVRQRLLEKIEPRLARSPEVEIRPGLDVWLPPPGHRRARPWRQAVLAWVVIYPLSLLAAAVLAPAAAAFPILDHPWARALVVTTLIVALMTWVVMPRATRALSGWLFG